MSDKLSDCPFCGSAVKYIQGYAPLNDCHFIDCEGCGMSSKIFDSKDAAIASWNRRASPAPAISESEDTKRLDFMATWGASVVWSRDRDVCWIVRYEDDDGELVSKRLSAAFDTPREAIDAARKGEKS
ncbi:Lar family restriction alleviation protein [Burkholderia gladioli]|uniref:Lar family restriction alleviation protein n=1 Tax=Burkholderia gladioli TaxID=28095 RepID=UPI001FC7F8C2|nr:Lar family restriction alleviation protein [Burkholderia gladioli]